MKKLLMMSFALGLLLSVKAQETSKKWNPSVELNFTAVPTYKYVGTDTSVVNTFSVAPAFSFRSPGGFGFMYSPRFVTGGSNPGLFAHLVSVGIEQYDKPNHNFVLDYNHWFFTNNSSVPYSPLNNEIYSSYTYKKAILRPTVSAGFGFGNDAENGNAMVSDFGLSAGVSHLFGSEKSAFSITPGVFLNAGTNQYFSFMTATKYLTQSSGFKNIVKTKTGKGNTGRGRGNSSGSGTPTGTTTTTQTAANSFGISNVELNFEGAYEKGPFAIRPMGSLYLPVGVNSGSPLDGYWQISFSYSF